MKPTNSSPPSAAARSLLAFGVYLCGAGALLIVAPAVVLTPLAIPVPADVWIRMVGLLALCLGASDLVAARAGFEPLIRLSVWRRAVAGLLMFGFVAVGMAPLGLAVLAAVDLAAAAWTALALRPAALPVAHGA
jgi:hypothetical protein